MNTPLPEQGRPPPAGGSTRIAWMGRYVAHAFRRSRKGLLSSAAVCGVYADPRDRFMSSRHRSLCDRCATRLGR